MAYRCLLYSVCLVYSAFQRTSVVRFVAMGQHTISKFLGVGPSFHTFNGSRQPWFLVLLITKAIMSTPLTFVLMVKFTVSHAEKNLL